MRTNFDVWRDSLTPEKMAGLLQDHSDWGCNLREHCPALEYCDSCHGKKSCKAVFTDWANAPAKEEAK